MNYLDTVVDTKALERDRECSKLSILQKGKSKFYSYSKNGQTNYHLQLWVLSPYNKAHNYDLGVGWLDNNEEYGEDEETLGGEEVDERKKKGQSWCELLVNKLCPWIRTMFLSALLEMSISATSAKDRIYSIETLASLNFLSGINCSSKLALNLFIFFFFCQLKILLLKASCANITFVI